MDSVGACQDTSAVVPIQLLHVNKVCQVKISMNSMWACSVYVDRLKYICIMHALYHMNKARIARKQFFTITVCK